MAEIETTVVTSHPSGKDHDREVDVTTVTSKSNI